ncbi:MAG TPA: hypothetical protein DCQ04_03565 [Actinobacteria bacterium]|nr:hypothetical protein [Actinomycetota bacterium]
MDLGRQRQLEAADAVGEHVSVFKRTLAVWDPRPGSQLEADHARARELQRRDGSAWGSEPVDTFCSLVALTATAMVDHLASVAHLLTADVDFGTMIVGRSVLEAAGRVCWMLEPDDLPSRVARGYAVWVRGLQQMSKNDAVVAKLESNNPEVQRQVANNEGQVQRAINSAHSLRLPVHRPSRNGGGTRPWQLRTTLPDGGVLVHAAMKQVNLEIPPGLSDLLFGSWSAISHSAYEALREVIDTVSAVQHGSAKLARFGTDPRSRAQGAMYSLLRCTRSCPGRSTVRRP